MVGKGLLPKTPDVEDPLMFNGLRCDYDKSLIVETETENKRVLYTFHNRFFIISIFGGLRFEVFDLNIILSTHHDDHEFSQPQCQP